MEFRKGQTAMEYLMTYGWAILVIMVVLAVLFYLGILNPRSITPSQCTFPAGLTCITYKLYTNGSLYLVVGEGTGRTINITGVKCSMNSSYLTFSPPGTVAYPVANTIVPITSGSSATVANPAVAAIYVNCTDTNNALMSSNNLGDTYNGKLYVNYTETDTGMTRNVMGSISTKFEV